MENIPTPTLPKVEKNKFQFIHKPYFYMLLFFVALLFYFYSLVFIPSSKFPVGQIFNIPPGSSLRLISKNMEDQGVIKSRPVFEAFVVMYGGEKHILPGDYLFEKKLPVFEIARRLSVGDRNMEPIKVTIPEGFNVSDIAEVMHLKLSKFDQSKFLKLAASDEGYLFPDTYFFFSNDTEENVHRAMRENFNRKVKNIIPQIENSGKSEKEIISMASIIEREAKGDQDRDIISGILWARIAKGMPLQVDAAPITYKEKGIPENPISNPGIESIKAALYPKSSPYLYYLHDKEGAVHYARTFEEHRQNKLKYLR